MDPPHCLPDQNALMSVVSADRAKSKDKEKQPSITETGLPEKYKLLQDFFYMLENSIQILKSRRTATTFAELKKMIELLTDRRFEHKHLAQLKHIMHEEIKIITIRQRDEKTSWIKPQLHITIENPDNGNMLLRETCSSRLLDFSKSHPEGDEVPEAPLPYPFGSLKEDAGGKSLCDSASFTTYDTPSVKAATPTSPSSAEVDDEPDNRNSSTSFAVVDGISMSLRRKVQENIKKQSMEKEIAQAKQRHGMIASLCDFFRIILFHCNSANRYTFTREELIQNFQLGQIRITDRNEIEARLQLMLELVPNWIYEKFSSRGIGLICVDKNMSADVVYERLVKAVTDSKGVVDSVSTVNNSTIPHVIDSKGVNSETTTNNSTIPPVIDSKGVDSTTNNTIPPVDTTTNNSTTPPVTNLQGVDSDTSSNNSTIPGTQKQEIIDQQENLQQEDKNAGKGTGGTKKRVYHKKVVHNGVKFTSGDDVYVKKRDGAASDDEDPEVEECKVCFKPPVERNMIECDECLNGYHLKCLKPPLKDVPEGDWFCNYCEERKLGKMVELPEPPKGKARTAREKLLSNDLRAAHIERLWKDVDGTYWFRARWYVIPEETSVGRQPHNSRRELFLTNDFADIQMESIIRCCFVKNPEEFPMAKYEGDDVFLCGYVHDINANSFTRIAEIDNNEDDFGGGESDDDWNPCDDADSDTEEDMEYDNENRHSLLSGPSSARPTAANSRKGRLLRMQKIGTETIPEHVPSRKQTDLERAKANLLLATFPKSLPSRDKEMDEITTFIKCGICNKLGGCLYIHGSPGTGKTMTVLTVMRNLRSEVDAGSISPYCFVEINCVKLASPKSIYSVIYEGLSERKVGLRKALNLLTERFSDENKSCEEDKKPCVLLIDELDLLVNRNQSVLYNIFDWTTKPNSKLIVIGISNAMDLPEKLLQRISSRMGIQKLCFAPYKYQQLQEIISSRLEGIDAFENPAIEIAARKVAAVSGDARRALEICRQAAEIADYRAKSFPLANSNTAVIVKMEDVTAAIKEMFQAPHFQVIRSCSKLSKIFLAAMVYQLNKTRKVETTFGELAEIVLRLCASNGEIIPGHDTLLQVGCKLGQCRILLCEPPAKHKLQKLQLNYPSEDVTFALRESEDLPLWLANYLSFYC